MDTNAIEFHTFNTDNYFKYFNSCLVNLNCMFKHTIQHIKDEYVRLMNKSKSYPEIYQHFQVNSLKKSKSLNDVNENMFYFESFFEGDGPLGIYFDEKEECIVVSDIVEDTVANETFGLSIGLILINVNNQSLNGMSFRAVMKLIGKSWKTRSSVFLQFKRQVNLEIYESLDSIDYLAYYDQFIELGAKEKLDFEFVEYGDLVKMGIQKEKIKDFVKLNTSILS